MKKYIFLLVCIFSINSYAQDITLYSQFSGHVDFTMIGNTLNLRENEGNDNQCSILTSSTASLNLSNNDYIEAAYLYWAGSGAGDFDIALNNQNLTAQRTFSTFWYNFEFFSAFYDVTNQVRSLGNTNYTLSDLDLNAVIPAYCQYGINFGGWAIVIVYSNDSLPLNQINVYDGMQSVVPNSVTIQLDNLDVIDNIGAQIGFLAWEGDAALAVSETLTFNGNVIGNPPLNPYNNAFNGTNSFTGATDLYNMDLDVYNIENNIAIGDTSATIELHSGQDFVMMNCIVTKLNSQLPDAIVQLNNYNLEDCNNRIINVDLSVTNELTATNPLPTHIPISFYAFYNNTYTLLNTIYTSQELQIGEAQDFNNQLLTIPNQVPNNFTLIAVADDDGSGNSTVLELNENNNQSQIEVSLPQIPVANPVATQFSCDVSTDINDAYALFDTSDIQSTILNGQTYMEVLYFDENGVALASPLPNPFQSSSQTVEVVVLNTLDNTCTATTTIDFTVVPIPSFEVFDNIICQDAFPNSTFVAVENWQDDYLYQWFDSSGNEIASQTTEIEVFEAGDYSVTASSLIDGDCTLTKNFSITNERFEYANPDDILLCDEGFQTATYDLESVNSQVDVNNALEISFYHSLEELHNDTNQIINATTYHSVSNPEQIFVKVLNEDTQCYNYTSFELKTERCPPVPPQLITPSADTNQEFTVRGLRDIYLDFTLKIYNRYGNLIFEGDNNTPDWDGTYQGKKVPSATYFYILQLNDDYFEYLQGWVYVL